MTDHKLNASMDVRISPDPLSLRGDVKIEGNPGSFARHMWLRVRLNEACLRSM
jgi:hypothetical protein